MVIYSKGSPQNSAVSGGNRVWDRQMRNWIRGYRQISFPVANLSLVAKMIEFFSRGGKVTVALNPPPDLIQWEDNNTRSHNFTSLYVLMG